MAANAEYALEGTELGANPVEMLVIGCALGTADSFANALRNQGQAVHLKTAQSVAELDKQLATEPCSLFVLNTDEERIPPADAIQRIRAAKPDASIISVGKKREPQKALAMEFGLQDFIDIKDPEHLALAIRREHQTLLLQHHGMCPVTFKYIDNENKITRVRAGKKFSVAPSDQFVQQVEELIGKNAVFLSS